MDELRMRRAKLVRVQQTFCVLDPANAVSLVSAPDR
jgi:hypothetical protein